MRAAPAPGPCILFWGGWQTVSGGCFGPQAATTRNPSHQRSAAPCPDPGGSSQRQLTPSQSYHRKVPSLTFLPLGGATGGSQTSH